MRDDAFIRAILAEPADFALRLVYADWLEEQGDPRGEYLRLLTSLASGSVLEESGSSQQLRLRELRSGLDPEWIALMEIGRFGPYLTRVRAGFAAAGFGLSEGVSFQQQRFSLLASSIHLGVRFPPLFVEEFFFFCECEEPGSAALLSPLCWDYALQHRNQSPPLLSYLVGMVLLCYVVALCPRVEPDAAEAIRSSLPQWHFAQGGTVPLAYDASSRQLHAFQGMRWLGSAWCAAMKDSIRQRLQPDGPGK